MIEIVKRIMQLGIVGNTKLSLSGVVDMLPFNHIKYCMVYSTITAPDVVGLSGTNTFSPI